MSDRIEYPGSSLDHDQLSVNAVIKPSFDHDQLSANASIRTGDAVSTRSNPALMAALSGEYDEDESVDYDGGLDL